MLKDIFLPLEKYFTFFYIFRSITFRAAYAAVTALFISFIFGPRLIMFLKKAKAGQEIREDGPESHFVKSGTPTMGGLLIIFSVTVSTLLWQDLKNAYTWLALLSLVAFGFIGFVDDYLKVFRRSSEGLHAKMKFVGQLVISIVVVVILYLRPNDQVSLLYVPFFKYPILDLNAFYILFGVFLLVGTSNAVNLTDGLDGLASGLIIFVGISFAVLSYLTGRADYAGYLQIPYLPGSGELTVICLSIVGACVGFLWYNAHPAEVFMGDTGSLALGGVIGSIAIMLKKEILLIVVCGVFVIETLSVIIQVFYFKRTGKRVFLMAPIHHHFEKKGWAESKVVIRLWILGGLFAILSLSTLKLQ